MKTALITAMLTLTLGAAIADEYQSIRQMYTDIKLLAEQDRSCDDESQCVAIALGSRACGGANGYTFTSTKNESYNTIREMASELAQRESQYNIDNRVISICSMAMQPNLVCENQVCAVSNRF